MRVVFATRPALHRAADLLIDPQRSMGSLGPLGSVRRFLRKGMGATADYLGRLGTRNLVLGRSLIPRSIGLLSRKLADISNRHFAGHGKRRLGN